MVKKRYLRFDVFVYEFTGNLRAAFLYSWLSANPNQTKLSDYAIADRLGWSLPTVQKYWKILIESGLISRKCSGREVVVRFNADGVLKQQTPTRK